MYKDISYAGSNFGRGMSFFAPLSDIERKRIVAPGGDS